MAAVSDEMAAEFIAFTGASAEEARQWIEMAGGDIQEAVNLFLEMGGGGGGGAGAAAAPSRLPDVAPGMDADVAAEVAAVAAAAGISTDAPPAEEEVRAPMAAFQDQIIQPAVDNRREQALMEADAKAMNQRMSFDRSEVTGGTGDAPEAKDGQAINTLFAPPHYNSPLPWLKLVEQAQQEEKWIIVNIQQADVFASHQLNRDVWSDEMIGGLLEDQFLFWQRDDQSSEGSAFLQYYKCNEPLPHICAVDPRTGRRVKSWEGRKWVEKDVAAEFILAFTDKFSMAKTPVMSPEASPSAGPASAPAVSPPADALPDAADVGMTIEENPVNVAAAAEAAAKAAAAEREAKRGRIPEEPAMGTPGRVLLQIRTPDGRKLRRAFAGEHAVGSVYDFADVEGGDAMPTLYRLVSTMPRQEFVDRDATCEAAGLKGQMMLMVETLVAPA